MSPATISFTCATTPSVSGAAEALELQHLAGELYIAESELRSGKVSGVLNGTPVTLLDLQLARWRGRAGHAGGPASHWRSA